MNYENRDTYGIYKGATLTGVNRNGEGPGPRLMGAETLIGNSVVNGSDEDLGEIKEIMLNVANGTVSYAVLSFGTFLGLGGKLFAVPWNALTLDTINKRFILNVDKEYLKDAPGFDPDRWPDMADSSWVNDLHTFYRTKPAANLL
jgi:sporulation protein YlmC with PRC-barrel domain